MKYIMHINYCEIGPAKFGKSIEEVFKKAAQWGYDGIEFRGAPPADLSLTESEYIDEIAKCRKKYGLEILFGKQAKDISSLDSEKRRQAVESTVEFFKTVNDKIGVTLSNTFGDSLINPDKSIPYFEYDKHGSAIATDDIWNYTAEGFSKIGAELQKIGVRIAFETHMVYLHDKPEAAKKLVDMIDSPAVGINMDFGNTVYFAEYPSVEDTIALYGDKLFYTHFKNSVGVRNSGRMPVALSEGEINHRLYLKALKEAGFEGPVGVEAPRGGDREYYAVNDLKYIMAVARDVGFGL